MKLGVLRERERERERVQLQFQLSTGAVNKVNYQFLAGTKHYWTLGMSTSTDFSLQVSVSELSFHGRTPYLCKWKQNKTKKKEAVSSPWQLLQFCQLPKNSHHVSKAIWNFLWFWYFYLLLHSFLQNPHCSRCSFRTQTFQNIDCNIRPKVQQQVARPPCLMHLTFSFS